MVWGHVSLTDGSDSFVLGFSLPVAEGGKATKHCAGELSSDT